MPRGPRLNNIIKNFTSRDSLGIEGVATSISADICPIVNTVTPRAFYWPFMVWIYYDFYKFSGVEDRTKDAFDSYLKRQDYFFVLANLLTPGSDQVNMVGKQQTQIDIDNNQTGPYLFNPAYFKTRYGGMQYYNAGCLAMGFIIDHNPNNPDESYKFPKLTKDGEQMALGFEKVIKGTEYYKSYRRNEAAVPKDVLVEFGKVINIGLVGFDDCKGLLKKKLFEQNYRLSKSSEYIKYLWKQHNFSELNGEKCRRAFFDYEDESGNKIALTDELAGVGYGWEIVVGRQYFTSGLEMIWKYMLEQLNMPITKEQWIKNVFELSKFTIDLKDKVADVLPTCEFGFFDREAIIGDARRSHNGVASVENGIRMIFSIYNRFYGRTDIDEEQAFFNYGADGDNIAFSELFEVVDKYKNNTLQSIILFIMDAWLIQQHYITAFDKMLQGRDGFYYEKINELYLRKHEFSLDFQGVRMIQLSQVMQDLDML